MVLEKRRNIEFITKMKTCHIYQKPDKTQNTNETYLFRKNPLGLDSKAKASNLWNKISMQRKHCLYTLCGLRSSCWLIDPRI